VFTVVYFVIESGQKLLDTPSYLYIFMKHPVVLHCTVYTVRHIVKGQKGFSSEDRGRIILSNNMREK